MVGISNAADCRQRGQRGRWNRRQAQSCDAFNQASKNLSGGQIAAEVGKTATRDAERAQWGHVVLHG